MSTSTLHLDGPSGLSDLLAEALGQVRLELAPEREPQANAVQGEVHGGDSPRVGVSPSIQSLQHRRLWQRVLSALVRHGRKVLASSIPVHAIALPDRHPYQIASAYALREAASTKRLAYALDASEPYAHRIRHAERSNPIGEAASWLHALAAKGLPTDELFALLSEAVERGRAEYFATHPYLRRA